MKFEELLQYVEDKGYSIEYRKLTNTVPCINIDGVNLYLCKDVNKFGMHNQTTQFNISKERFENMIYLVKAYGKQASRELGYICLGDYDFWRLEQWNNSKLPQDDTEIELAIDNRLPMDEPDERMIQIRTELLAARGIEYRKV